ncbi:uncharacterized protein [Dendropsophus ebraccatus]|uniref:uncharacterized protein n=1 Tax=Dendropsophus ebraccatus TaxID=150705 RepID=UPI003831DB6E
MAKKYPGKRFYTMYHGTTVSAAYSIIKGGFRVSDSGMLGRGVYVSRDVQKASRYPLCEAHQKVVLKLSVRVGKVKKIDHRNHPLQLTWHDHGYDSAWVPAGCGMVASNLEEDCIYHPRRIRVKDVVSPSTSSTLPATPVEGKFYTMYHGTTVTAAYSIINEGFQVSDSGMLGRGVYVSRDVQKASRYPLFQAHDQVVLKLSVRVGRVKKIDHQDHPLRLTWHEHGYDSAWVPAGCDMVASNLEEDCIYDPHRIRVKDVVSAPSEHIHSLKQLIAEKRMMRKN